MNDVAVGDRLWIYDWRGPHALRAMIGEVMPKRVAIVTGEAPDLVGPISRALPGAEIRVVASIEEARGWADLAIHLPDLARRRLRPGVWARRSWAWAVGRARVHAHQARFTHVLLVAVMALLAGW